MKRDYKDNKTNKLLPVNNVCCNTFVIVLISLCIFKIVDLKSKSVLIARINDPGFLKLLNFYLRVVRTKQCCGIAN